jgi:hypothetical protein
MSLMFVLIFYALGQTIAASVGAAILGGAAFFLTHHAKAGRKRAITASVSFPFLCVAYAAVWFVAYAVINYTVFDRDPGLGDGWQTPLPNGYALMMIDTTDQGTVYNPKTQIDRESVNSRDDAVFGVRQLQVSGPWIFGARDTGYFGRIGQDSKLVDAYFELDTRNRTHTEFKSWEDLKQEASGHGVALHLRPFDSVFGDFRTTWFDYLAGVLLLLFPVIGFVLLALFVWRIRQNDATPSDKHNWGAAQSF